MIVLQVTEKHIKWRNTMDDNLSRLQSALIMGLSGTMALLLVAIIFDYPSVSRALLVGLLTTIVWYVFDPRLLANSG
ncbi:hypothetical protein CP556_18230 [Natrinema sp. CBA1119]|nr:hypothetical protein CP556_18230 [Natrinema sp. CBA1119]